MSAKQQLRGQHRLTFKELLRETQEDAASTLWAKAKLASDLRHVSRTSGGWWQARTLGRLKKKHVRRAIELAPAQIRVTIDDDYQVGLLSVRWEGHGWLHLPADSQLPHLDKQPSLLASA